MEDLPKKEIISNNNNKSDSYTEIKLLTKRNSNNNNKIEKNDKKQTKEKGKEKVKTPIKLKDAFGDLTAIIKQKIKAKMKKNNKRVLSVSGISSITNVDKNYKIINSMQSSRFNTIANSNSGYMDIYSKIKENKKLKSNISPTKNNKNEKIQKVKKKAELFINF